MSAQRESLLPFSEHGDVIASRGKGLFSCCDDMSIFCLGYFCPCYLFGRTAHRAGVVSSTFCGCLMFMVPIVIMWALAFIAMLHFLSGIDAWDNCMHDAPQPPAGSGDGSSDGDLASDASAPEHDHCDDLLTTAMRAYVDNTLAIQVLFFVLVGGLLGYYRRKISAVLGHEDSWFKSFLLHCLPCTNACALCQEARAVEMVTVSYSGLEQPTSKEARVSF